MDRNLLFKLILIAWLSPLIFSFNFKQFISSLESSFTKEAPKHSLNFTQSPEGFFYQFKDINLKAFIQKIKHVEPSENIDQLAQVSKSAGRAHQIQDPKLSSITKTMDKLTDVKNSCNQLIEIGEQKREKDYQQCIQTVSNFNCSYSEEWKHLKSKHKQNITNMQQEIKAKDKTIALIRTSVQKKSESKNSLIKEIIPEISQIEKNIGQVELILELMGEAFDKNQKQQSEDLQPNSQILIKKKTKTEPEPEKSQTKVEPEKQKQQNNTQQEQEQENHHREQQKQKQIKEKEQIENNLEKQKQMKESKQKELDSTEQELEDLISEEKQIQKQNQNSTSQIKKLEEQNNQNDQNQQKDNEQQLPQQQDQVEQQKQEINQDSLPIRTIEEKENLFTNADEAVENIEEQYDKDNINDLLDGIQDRNLFDDAHTFTQTKMKMKNPNQFDQFHYDSQKSISQQILNNQFIADDDKESLWLIANEESHLNNRNFESLKLIFTRLQYSLDVALIRGKISEQQNQLAPLMRTKLLTLHSQLKSAKEEKDNQIKTLEDLIQNEYQLYAQKIFSIQVEKHKLVEEIQKKQDWINQLESKITDCENQDIMLVNCENAKEQDIAYLKQLEEFKAIAEGSLEQIKYLLDYKNIPIVAIKQEATTTQELKKAIEEQGTPKEKQTEIKTQVPEEKQEQNHQQKQEAQKQKQEIKQLPNEQAFIQKTSKKNQKLKKKKQQNNNLSIICILFNDEFFFQKNLMIIHLL